MHAIQYKLGIYVFTLFVIVNFYRFFFVAFFLIASVRARTCERVLDFQYPQAKWKARHGRTSNRHGEISIIQKDVGFWFILLLNCTDTAYFNVYNQNEFICEWKLLNENCQIRRLVDFIAIINGLVFHMLFPGKRSVLCFFFRFH